MDPKKPELFYDLAKAYPLLEQIFEEEVRQSLEYVEEESKKACIIRSDNGCLTYEYGYMPGGNESAKKQSFYIVQVGDQEYLCHDYIDKWVFPGGGGKVNKSRELYDCNSLVGYYYFYSHSTSSENPNSADELEEKAAFPSVENIFNNIRFEGNLPVPTFDTSIITDNETLNPKNDYRFSFAHNDGGIVYTTSFSIVSWHDKPGRGVSYKKFNIKDPLSFGEKPFFEYDPDKPENVKLPDPKVLEEIEERYRQETQNMGTPATPL